MTSATCTLHRDLWGGGGDVVESLFCTIFFMIRQFVRQSFRTESSEKRNIFKLINSLFVLFCDVFFVDFTDQIPIEPQAH